MVAAYHSGHPEPSLDRDKDANESNSLNLDREEIDKPRCTAGQLKDEALSYFQYLYRPDTLNLIFTYFTQAVSRNLEFRSQNWRHNHMRVSALQKK